MKIIQLRNATIALEFEIDGRPEGVLVDPMLAPRGALPTLRYFGGDRRRNPLVELPPNAPDVLDRVTHCLITHCQRGHFDHLDRAGMRFLRERQIPVVCMPRDRGHLTARGLVVKSLGGAHRQPFFTGYITPIPCIHGRGLVGRLMEHGYGYFIELPNQPSVYVSGDTLLTEDVARCLRELKPAVSILPAGGARFDIGGEVIMNELDVCRACELTPGIVIANHLEALDHCPTTRATVVAAAQHLNLAQRLLVPLDGQTLAFDA